MKVFDPDKETMRPDLREQVQLERLQALLARLRKNVRRYREYLTDVAVEDLSDLTGLPFTAPDDLLAAFPYGMFALPLREVIRLHSIVGPEGKQLVFGYTRNDLELWARLTARQLVAAGVTSNDVIQVAFNGGFLGQALGFLLGAEHIEASVVPEETFHVEYQLEVMQNYRTTVLITTPTNARDLMELLNARGIDPQSLNLRTIILSRPVSSDERDALKTGLFAAVVCNFGISEILDPGFCVECQYQQLHINEDSFLVEQDGEELVVTSLQREALPLLRYRTRTTCKLEDVRCPCGRTGRTIRPGKRLDGRLRVNEMPVYENQIAQVLAKTRAAGQPFKLAVGERQINVDVEISEAFFGDQMRVLADLREEIETEFMTRLGIRADVRYSAPPIGPAS